jgi:hypothetical protein
VGGGGCLVISSMRKIKKKSHVYFVSYFQNHSLVIDHKLKEKQRIFSCLLDEVIKMNILIITLVNYFPRPSTSKSMPILGLFVHKTGQG